MNDIFSILDDLGADTDDALERFMDDEEMYEKYILAFPDEPTMAALTAAVEAKDYDAAEKAVHTLKGLTINLGFDPLADAAVDMLAELRDKNIPDALTAYSEVCREYNKYCTAISKWRKEEN